MKTKKQLMPKNFRGNWSYIWESRSCIWLAVSVFAVFLIIALAFPAPEMVAEKIKEVLKQLVEKTSGLNAFGLIAYIFANNLFVSALGIFLGIIFCIAPFLIAASNGYVLGFVIKLTVEKLGAFDGIVSLWRIFPHGIFEIPAVIISLALGIRLGVSAFQSLNKKSAKILWSDLKKSFMAFLFIILPLLAAAAVIEGVLIKIIG